MEETYKISLKAGKKTKVCVCGLSETMPFCDNSHRAYNEQHGTYYKSMKILSEKDVEINIKCGIWESLK